MNTGKLPAILVAVGPEKWLRAEILRDLTRQCIAPGFEEMDRVRFPQPPSDPLSLLEALLTPPFGSPLRLVVAEGYSEAAPETWAWLEGYVKNPNPKACLMLCAEKLGAGTHFLSRPHPNIRIRWCPTLKGAQLERWISERVSLRGKRIEPQAARLLAARRGPELQALETAIEQVLLLIGEAPRVSVGEVEALIVPTARETAFDILDAAASGAPESGIAMLRQALAQGRLTIEHHLLGALGWYYRMIWKNRRLGRWPRPRLRQAFEEVLEADTQVKLGHPAPELLADQLLLKLGES